MYVDLKRFDSRTHRTLAMALKVAALVLFVTTASAAETVLTDDYRLEQFRPAGGEFSGQTVDASSARWTVANSKNSYPTWSEDCEKGNLPINKYPLILEKQDDMTFEGGLIESNIHQESEWSPSYCNSAALAVFQSSNATIDGIRIDGAWDGVRFAQETNEFALSNSWLSNVRDDCIENDHLKTGVISDSLFDGCFVGISVRPSAGSTKPDQAPFHTVTLDGVLLKMKQYPYRKSRTDSLRNTHGHVLKMHKSSPAFVIRNSVFAYEAGRPFAGDENLDKGFAKTTSCSNNYALWLSNEPLPSYFNYFPESCFTILAGQEALDYWELRRTNWIDCHPSIARLDSDDRSVTPNCDGLAEARPEPPTLLGVN